MAAPLKLDVVIVGAGLAGIATAFRMGHDGHRVRVVDDREQSERGCTGAHIPPNATKILTDWGFKKDVESSGNPLSRGTFYSMDTGELIGRQTWREEVMRELGANQHYMHYQDLYTMLYKAAVNIGVNIRFGKRVVNVETDLERPRVTLADRTILEADLIIGADGPNSFVRRTLFGDGPVNFEGHTLFTGVIPMELIKKDTELSNLCRSDRAEWPIWIDSSRHSEGALVRNETEFALHVFYPNDELSAADDSCWEGKPVPGRPPNTIDPKLHRLVDMCPEMHRQKLIIRQGPEEWTDDSGKIILIGQAAHPIHPCWVLSCSVHLEDAETLGTLLSRITDLDQLPGLLEGFQEVGGRRARYIRDISWQEIVGPLWLSPGPARNMRDEALRKADDDSDWDDAMMRKQFDGFYAALGYNARDAADDWWTTWGLLRERSKSVYLDEILDNFTPFGITMEEAVHSHGA
ncbi:FAD/NAD(P)-binding domain-containing protein [Coniophora puteana RWD-64-598 SS2]|uniref:FAD/NAD(P)-binding domain-containing protein n=1 Tax=Coniophora puteana (strain RWD-64-598) TaxID=741705 RepID=A0A5M3MW57_CONPW|nr:FAD/NAD(P)-binding domain-containing protein [Coniophora puteana RWD-64-598 SS2]EIW83388.1 FAD/NAD(P)-binding domain-containing protein [Coniophora puteana RWD-64-598 SS2]